MSKRVWNGTTMRDGLSAGRLEVRASLGTNVEPGKPVALKPAAIERDDKGTIVRVRLVDYRRVASVTLRRVSARPPVEAGDGAWSPALVEARLRRAAETFNAMPGAADIWPGGYKSTMPTPVREPFHDWENDRARPPRPGREEISTATSTWEWLLDVLFDKTDGTRLALAEAVANNLRTREGKGWSAIARALRARADCLSLSRIGAQQRARRVLDELAAAWSSSGHAFDEVDIRRAVSLQAAGKSVVIH